VTPKRRKSPPQGKPSPTNTKNHLSSFRYHFFGGKGGVGKTTSAAATALALLNTTEQGESVLLFSTDPAHSLSDSLAVNIGNSLTEVRRLHGAKLIAYEMDASLALERFRAAHGKVLTEIAERGTLLDEADINELLNLSLPGLDEVMSLFELSELDRSSNYRHIVVDTAPSGHTSRLLRLPEVFLRMVNALDRMADKHRYMVAHFARRKAPLDEVDLFLRDLNQRIERVRGLLYDQEQTTFTLVAIPEAMSVCETERYFDLLQQQGVPVRDLIINRIEADHDGCEYCRARVCGQRPWLKEMSAKFADLRLHHVPLLPQEVRGFEDLKIVGQLIWQSAVSKPKPVRAQRRVALNPGISERSKSPAFPFDDRKIVIFGGTGGVGKTTAAGAFALSLAKKNPKNKLLIFSSDPAHSLSDSFGEKIGGHKKRVARLNLDAMEIDPGRWFDDLKQRYRAWTDDLFASLSGGSRLEIQFDREAMRELVELTPPGIDEIAALGTISELLDSDQYHSIILDTAPTGHLVRFLELPNVALSWVRTFIKLLLKYQHVVHATQVAEDLVALSKSIKRVLALLTNPDLTEFVGVAIPERMSLEETADLSVSLNKLGVPMQRLLINGLIPESAAASCSFCESRRKAQGTVLNAFQRHFGRSAELYVAPQQPHEIRGAPNLLNHFQQWQLLNDSTSKPRTKGGLRRTSSAVKNVGHQKHSNERKRTEKRAAC
jgi:arsenite/tail-anchored protein-transporting ATPase